MRLIDADRLRDRFASRAPDYYHTNGVLNEIDMSPAVVVDQHSPEAVRGFDAHMLTEQVSWFECGNCYHRIEACDFYCRNCGGKIHWNDNAADADWDP